MRVKREKPQWVMNHVATWASEHEIPTTQCEVSWINGGYYLYIHPDSNKRHTYIGAIKENGIQNKRERKARIPKCDEKKVHTSTILEKMTPQVQGQSLIREYGFSKATMDLTHAIPEWQRFYGEDADTVLFTLIQSMSHLSYTREFFSVPDKPAYPYGYAKRLLDHLLPVSLNEILACLGDLCLEIRNDGTRILSEYTPAHREFCKKHNIQMEVE